MSEKKRQVLHFLTHASENAGDWPFFQSMHQKGVQSVVFGSSVPLKYPHRIWLYLIGWPRLLLSGLLLANNAVSKLEKDVIVTNHDHMLLLAYKIRCFFSLKARSLRPKLVLHGFIFTPRKSALLNRVRKFYFRSLLKNVAMVICHSKHEVPYIKSLVDPKTTKIVPVRFGIGEGQAIKAWHKDFLSAKKSAATKTTWSVVSAGRSSRDYETLAAAMETSPLPLRCDIICDNILTAPSGLESARVKIHRSLYGDDYANMLINADIIAVPLSEAHISAGQMVLLHALAAAKPIIITRTATSTEYVEESELIKLVPAGDAPAFAAACEELCALFPLSFDKRMQQRQLFDDHFSDAAHGQAVFAVFKKYLFKSSPK